MRVVEIFAGETARHVHIRGDGEREVTDMVIDSRKVSEGALFAALGGPHRDGHAYLRAALDAGAGALLVESGQGPAAADAVVVEAEEVRSVLGPAASRFFGKPTERMDLFGVTGTNGKTSVTNILEGILRAAGKATGVMGTIEYRWRDHRQAAACTTPEATDLQRTLAAMADDGVEAAVMEVSSHALAQKRVRGCRFRTAVFTNLSRDHLDFHRDMEDYFEAKSLLFSAFGAPVRVANGDDPWGRRLAESSPGTLLFGTSPGCDFRGREIETGRDGLRLVLESPDGHMDLESRLVGAHNVSNVLAAAAAALASGISAESVERGVSAVRTVPGRFERVPAAAGPLVLVDYAHTPDALEKALRGARETGAGRLVVVFGCGGDRDRGKRPLMGAAAAQLADVTWLTSDNPRSEDPATIIEAIRQGWKGAAGGRELHVEVDRRRAIAAAVAAAAADDVVLIAGKGHEDYQEAAGARTSFSDSDEARRALETWKR